MKNIKTVRMLLASLTFTCIVNASAQFGMVAGSSLGNTIQGGSDIAAIDNSANPFYVITWHDYRVSSTNLNVYAQCYNYSGVAQWTTNGLGICTSTGNQLSPKIVADGTYFYIAWEDNRGGNSDIYIDRIDASGTSSWASNGKPVVTNTSAQTNIEMKVLGNGNILVTWEDSRNVSSGGGKDIYGQVINATTGNPVWTTGGLPITYTNGDQQKQKIYENNNSKIMVVWEDVASSDIYGQLIAYNGSQSWTTFTGNKICSTASVKTSPQVVSTGADFFVSWIDDRSSLLNPYYAIMDDATGTPTTEVLACAGGGTNTATRFISMISDRASGVYIAWDDYRNGTDYDAYATRIDNTGTAVWSGGERQVTNNTLHVWEPRMVTCDDEMIVVYAVPVPSNGYNLYYNKFVTANGNFVSGFSLAGTGLDVRSGNQWKHRVTIMQGKAVASYDDNNFPGNNYDISSAEMSISCSTYVNTSSMVINNPTGIDYIKNSTVADYKLYPNPVLKELTILHPTETHISKIIIMSMDGRVVKEIENFEVGNGIDVSGLAVGQYLVRFPDSAGTSSFRIVKQ